jgi:hypothetical protein
MSADCIGWISRGDNDMQGIDPNSKATEAAPTQLLPNEFPVMVALKVPLFPLLPHMMSSQNL